MRTLRKTLAILLVFSVFLACSPALAEANSSLNLDASKNADGTVSANVSISGTEAVAGMQFSVTYDSSKLSLDSATGAENTGGHCLINSQTEGVVNVMWFSEDGSGIDLGNGSSILSLSFTPKQNSGSANLALGGDQLETMVINADLDNIGGAGARSNVSVALGASGQSSGGSGSASYGSSGSQPVITAAPEATAEIVIPVEPVPAAQGREDSASGKSGHSPDTPSPSETATLYDGPVLAGDAPAGAAPEAPAGTAAAPATQNAPVAPAIPEAAALEVMVISDDGGVNWAMPAAIAGLLGLAGLTALLLWKRNRKDIG